MKQPDFQRPFAELSKVPRRLRYELRPNSCFGHDLLYISSLIHDARLRPTDFHQRGKRVSLSIERDCWELPLKSHGDSTELHVSASRLSISPVNSVEWRFERADNAAGSAGPLWIHGLYLAEDFHDLKQDAATLVVHGFSWQLRLGTDKEPKVLLRDLTVPVLDSVFYAKRRRHAG